MAMLMEKLALVLDRMNGFYYIRGDHRIEVWLSDKEELPIVISNINDHRYIISSGNLSYEVADEAKAYRYVMQVFFNMNGTSSDYKFITQGLRTPC